MRYMFNTAKKNFYFTSLHSKICKQPSNKRTTTLGCLQTFSNAQTFLVLYIRAMFYRAKLLENNVFAFKNG